MFSHEYEGTVVTKNGERTLTVLVNLKSGILNVPDTDENVYDILILKGQKSTGIFYIKGLGHGIYGCEKPQYEMLKSWIKENTLHPIYISDLISRLFKFFKRSK